MRVFATRRFGIAAFVLVTLLSSAEEKANRQISDRLTASDIFNLQFAADPQISPDGKRIVYVREMADIRSEADFQSLGAQLRRLGRPSAHDGHVQRQFAALVA